VLVTGALGFVGAQVVKHLLGRGVKVRLVVREGSESKLPESTHIEKTIFSKDLFSESTEWWSSIFEGVELIIHCAWYAEPGKYLDSPKNISCLEGTLRMALAASRSLVKKFVGIGTCFEYDTSHKYLSKDTPLLPKNMYSASKVSAFLMLSKIFSQTQSEFLWCRLFYLYGDGEDDRKLAAYVKKQLASKLPVLLSDGLQTRDYLDVNEAAEQIVDLALGSTVGPINICSGMPVTVRDFVSNLAKNESELELLKFGVRENNLDGPNFIVGIKLNDES
jgi:nucleoside-diphosphate-sugar epimerase